MRVRNPDLKIIFVSGYAEEAFDKSLPQNQQFAFLAKPFALSALIAKVKETMARCERAPCCFAATRWLTARLAKRSDESRGDSATVP